MIRKKGHGCCVFFCNHNYQGGTSEFIYKASILGNKQLLWNMVDCEAMQVPYINWIAFFTDRFISCSNYSPSHSLRINLTPSSFFPTPKICHIKFDPVFDPSKAIMLGIEGIKYCRNIPGSWDPVHLPNPTTTMRLMVAYTSVGGMQAGDCSQGECYVTWWVNNIKWCLKNLNKVNVGTNH